MKFEKVSINNFRNFEDIEINLTNKNIFFGLNDVGKTNFLYALRFVFDKDIRKQNMVDSDFYNKNTEKAIEIVVTIDISDTENEDSQKLRAQLKGALLSGQDKVYIKLQAEYNNTDMIAVPILSWGGDFDSLREMKQRGYLYELDYVFDVIYVDSYVDLYSLFKKNINKLISSENTDESEEDRKILGDIQSSIDNVNDLIAQLSGIKEFEGKLIPEYQKYQENGIEISIKSELAVKGLYSNIIPYIKQESDTKLYPTAGEGRKKLLCYSIFSLLSQKNAEKKINLFLIEEPENHLHKSKQILLSQILFTEEMYRYLFVTTHSPYILYEMDNVNLIRIYSNTKIISASTVYKVPQKYEQYRKLLNKELSEAIFANKVLLVEGPSEYALFNKVLSVLKPFYESEGIYILSVNGIGFSEYCHILNELKIDTIIKTDNDLRYNASDRMYIPIGFSRINKLLHSDVLPKDRISNNRPCDKRKLYLDNQSELDEIRCKHRIYLSKIDLENDLDEFMHDRLVELLGTDDPVKYLQDAKKYNMVLLVSKLDYNDCNSILEHYNFACLKEVIG